MTAQFETSLEFHKNPVSTQTFDYTELDATTADFLRTKETNMREIVGKAYTDLGRELKETQDALAKNGYGCFRAWCESIGMKKDAVSRLIQRYDLIVANCDEREMLEDLPLSLTYEIAKPSAESTDAKAQAKAEVLDGSIATLKEYRERIAELEAKAAQAQQQALQADSARRQADERAELAEQKAQQYEQVFGDQTMYDASTTKVTNGDAITYAVYSFQEDVLEFTQKYAHLPYFAREFDEMIDEGREEYLKAIDSAMTFLTSLKRRVSRQDATIIEQ